MQATFTPEVKQLQRKFTHKTPNISLNLNLEQLSKSETEIKDAKIDQHQIKVLSPISSNKLSKKSSINTAKEDANFLKYLRDQNKQKQMKK